MFANVFIKTVRDRVNGMLIGTISVGVLLAFSIAVYRDVDTSFYYDLPAAFLELFGVPAEGEGLGGVAFGAMYNMIGAFVLAGIGITMGASAIAGEERDGTIGLLLGNPLSRRHVVISKSLSLVTVIGLGSLILWAFGLWTPPLFDTDMTGVHVGAAVFAMFWNALVYGFMALAIGTWTGNRGAASGVSAAVMVIGYLAAGILPLIESVADVARIFPWYYYNSSQPVINGIDWGHIAVLVGLVLLCFAGAYLGVTRRDLKEKSTQVTLVDRLREYSRTKRVIERVAGSARVSRIAVKTASEFQVLLIVTASIMFYIGLMMGPLYSFIPEDIKDFVGDFPDALVAMIGGADMATATGFLQGEIFSITGPIAIIVLTASIGARALAGEEEGHTMGLLLGNPIPRSHVIAEKSLAMTAHAVMLGAATFLGTWLGVLLGGLDVAAGNIAAASTLLTLLGLVFGGLALAVGAATGRARVASGTAAGAGVLGYFMWTFLPLSSVFEGWAVLSPFHYYLGSDPLNNGMAWGDAGLLTLFFLTLIAISIPLFQGRDLRG